MNQTSIYEKALGDAFHKLHPLLKLKFGKTSGFLEGHGTMTQIHGASIYRIAGMLMAADHFLFPEREKHVPFTIVNRYETDQLTGMQKVIWDRTFYFKQKKRRFFAVMSWDAKRREIFDDLGISGRFSQPLTFQVTPDGALLITSEQTHVKIRETLVPLPKWLSARVNVYERAIDEERLHIFVHIEQFGTVMMYEGEVRVTRKGELS